MKTRKINPPTHYSEWVNAEIEYVVEVSEPHDFHYHEQFHPGRGNQVAQKGWRAVIVAKWRGQEKRAEVCIGLSKVATESIARDSATECLDLSSFNEGPYVDDGTGKLVKNPFAPK
jgi:hypothetical protein